MPFQSEVSGITNEKANELGTSLDQRLDSSWLSRLTLQNPCTEQKFGPEGKCLLIDSEIPLL